MTKKRRHEERGTGSPSPRGSSPGIKAPVGGTQAPALPSWLPAVVYAAVTLLLFRKFVFSGEMLLGQDTLSLGFMARDFFAQALRQGTFPFWNPVILGGTPFLDSLAGGDSLYPTSMLLLVMEPYRALGWKLVLHVFLAGLFTYGWVRALGRSQAAAFLSGLAYLLAPFMVTLVFPGHDGKLFVTALTPLLFWATERALTGGRLRAFAGMALVIGLVLLTTHFQQGYFLFGAVGVYAVARTVTLWREGLSPGRLGVRFGLFLAFSVVGAGVGAIQLLPAVDYVTEFSRRTATTTQATQEGSVAYSSSWSLHPEEVASMVVPEFAGNSAGGADWATGTYWGRNPFKLNHEYAGLVVLLLAGLAFFGAPAPGLRFTFLGIGGVALLYALGAHTPVWRIFYELVPGISLFRAPSIAAFLFGFGAVTLMAFGVDRLLEMGGGGTRESGREGDDRRIQLFLMAASGLLLLGTLLASTGVLTSAWMSVLGPAMDPGREQALARVEPFIARGFLVATLLAAALWGLTWAFKERKVSGTILVAGLGLLAAVDLARVNDPFIQTLDFREWAAPDPNIRYLVEQRASQDPFRVLSMGGQFGLGQDVKPGMFGLELAAGHHPNDLAPYRELIGMVGSGIPANFFDMETGGLNLPVLSILNVRFVIWPVHQFGGLPEGEVVMATTLGGDRLYEAVYEIPTLPRARLVGEAVLVPEEETVSYLLSPAFRPDEEVVLNEEVPLALGGLPVEGEVLWLERGPNRLRLEVRSQEPALLVLADNWYPAWKARVGEKEVPVLRANHTLRAVPVEAGSQVVEVYYDLGYLRGPLLVTLGSLVLLGAASLAGARGPGRPGPDGRSGAGGGSGAARGGPQESSLAENPADSGPDGIMV
jgi:hypothetical protein